MHAFRLGRIGGIELRVDPSWILIFLLLTWSLGAMFGSWHPQWGMSLSLALGGIAALSFFASVLLHEVAHCLVALAYGIPVRDITLHLFGGLASIERDPPSAKAEFWMAIAGPAVSFAIAFIASVAGTSLFMVSADGDATLKHLEVYRQFGPFTTLLLWLGTANLIVGLFNLLPGLPLDGGRVLRAGLWAITGNVRRATRWAALSGQLIGWVLVFAGILMVFGTQVPLLGRGFGPGLWTALIGWFLRGAAVQSFSSAVLQDLLEGVHARDLMRRNGPWVRADLPVVSLVNDAFLRREERSYPVFEGDRFVGVVSIEDVRDVPVAERDTMLVGQIMTARERVSAVAPDTPLYEALRAMRQAEGNEVPVIEGEQLVGVLHDADVGRWLELHAETRAGAARPRSATGTA
ncbi:MAG: site-2 protease family protein [Polyangiaceae bacterium]|nr:site-2 protease family protein [Polyangiaceae bacterium]